MGTLNKILDCLETQKENDGITDELLGDILTKECLIHDELANEACPEPLVENGLNKEAGTMTLEGDVSADYQVAGQTIQLQNVAGDICGSATVAAGLAAYNPDLDQTVVMIEECELQEGKTPVQIVKAKPVLQATALAVKALATNTNLSVLKKTATAERVKTTVVAERG